MNHDPIGPISPTDAERAFVYGSRDEIIHALIGSSIHGDDPRWVQQRCVNLSTHSDLWVRRACATALLHIARIHRRLDWDSATLVFDRLRQDPETAGIAEDTLDQIHAFLRSD